MSAKENDLKTIKLEIEQETLKKEVGKIFSLMIFFTILKMGLYVIL